MIIKDRKTKRNIRRNLPRYDDNRIDTVAIAHYTAGKVCALILAVFIPFVPLFGAANIILKAPDLYQFDLDRTESFREINLSLGDKTGKELATLMSDFMKNHIEEFRPEERVMFQGKESWVFTRPDRMVMERARRLLDSTLLFFFILLPVTGGAVFLLVRFNRRKDLWVGYNIGLGFFGLIAISLLVLSSFPNDRYNLFQWVVGVKFSRLDILPQLFDNGFYVEATFLIAVVSAAALFVGRGFVKKYAVQNKMF